MPHPTGVIWKTRANYWAGWAGVRAVGGALTLTADRLTFKPHAFERLLRGKGFEASVDDVTSVETARRNFPRTRMFVHLSDGSTAAFLIPRVEERSRQLQDLLDS